jgi:hypothetical protein
VTWAFIPVPYPAGPVKHLESRLYLNFTKQSSHWQLSPLSPDDSGILTFLPYLLTVVGESSTIKKEWLEGITEEATCCAATQQHPSILEKVKVHSHVHKNPPTVPTLSQNITHTTQNPSKYYSPAYVLVFLVVSFCLAFPPI